MRMRDTSQPTDKLPPEQEAIRAKCFHPAGTFIEFKKEGIEQSIPERFEQLVRSQPDRLAIKNASESLTYAELKTVSDRLAGALQQDRGNGAEPVALMFDDLGGHSLAATRVVSHVIKYFQVEIPLHSLFQAPTIAEMAAVITEHRTERLEANDLERILAELESLSEEEAEAASARRRQK
jgi:non-ribosomal peptide synthetase component F